MTKNEFLDIFNDIDDEFLNELAAVQLRKKQADEITSWEDEEALKPKYFREDSSLKSVTPFKKIMLAVGAVACVAAVGIFIRMKNNTLPVSPNDSANVSGGVIISGGNSETSGISVPENLILDLDLPEKYPSELPAVYVQPRMFDDELIRTVFVKDSVITEQSIKENRCHFKTEDGGLYSYNENSVLIKKGGDIASSQSAFHSLWGNLCFDKIFSDKEISFSKTDAKKRADEVIASLGIENVGVPKIYSVSADEANTVYDKFFLDNNNRQHPIWSENDGIYIFEYPITFENVPVAVKGLNVSEEVSHFETVISVVVAENDIVYFSAHEIYKTDYKKGDIIPISISPSKALKILTDFYSKVVIQVPFTIYDCELVYITAENSPETKLIPAWQFSVYKDYFNDSDDYPRQDYIILDANSGRIIYG